MDKTKLLLGSLGDKRRLPWRYWIARYGLAVLLFGSVIGLAILVDKYELHINLTIPIIGALVVAAWFGGRGPGLLVSILFQATTIAYIPVPQGSTIPKAIFGHFSTFALYVFLTMLISGLKRLLKDLRRERDRLRKSERLSALRTRELSALFGFTNSIQQARSMEDVYMAALEAVFIALRCDRASVLLFDDGRKLRYVASRGLSDEYRNATEGHSPWQPGEMDPKPIAISDVKDSDLSDELKTVVHREGIASLGFVPLVLNDSLIGKLMVYFDRQHEFTNTELDLATTVGRQIAAGVARKRTENLLLDNEERLRLATETGNVGVWDWNVRDDHIEWTDSVFKIYGVERSEMGGSVESFESLVHPDDLKVVKKRVEQALSGEMPYDVQFRLRRPDGTIRTLFTNAVTMRDENGPFRMIGATVDITDRLRFEEARRESEIMHRLVEAQEGERLRIARDLHDHLGQRMTALRLGIASLTDQSERGEDFGTLLADVQDAANQVDRDIAFLSWELRPTELENLGLIDAVRTFVREWSQHYGIKAEFQTSQSTQNGNSRFSEVVETNLYRIVQEALNNILKHADAKAVSVLFHRRDDDLVLIVEDDGRGFESSLGSVHGNGGTRGLGLIGMHERAAVLKGSLEIDSVNGSGTTVIARVPIH